MSMMRNLDYGIEGPLLNMRGGVGLPLPGMMQQGKPEAWEKRKRMA